jgi:23S rRNA pseudouridine1911/1915/1917 synthase
MRAEVPAALDGERADLVVARLGGLSRAQARALVDAGIVTVDGVVATSKRRVSVGSVVEFEPPAPVSRLEPEAVDFEVRYEDQHLAVVDKPTGVVTHPGAGNRTGTLAAGILHRWPRVRGVGAEDRWGLVHRLDRGTSGLLVVALSGPAYDGLRSAIRAHAVERRYVALVVGRPGIPTGTIDAPIARDRGRPMEMRVDPEGRPARTHYRTLEMWQEYTLLELRLETGRTHQIRVHLGAIGLPVVGDAVYGVGRGAPRVFLHAAGLAFDHPITGSRVEVTSPLPPDLQAVIEALG